MYVSTLAERIGTLGEAIAPADRDTFVAAAEKTTAEGVIPAYRRVRDFLAEQLPKATDDAGVWRLPRGDAFYAQALRTFTTTSLTADEIHAIGLREVARLEGEMDTILRQLGYASGTVNARYAQLEAALQPKGTGDPRPGILADNEVGARRRAACRPAVRPASQGTSRRAAGAGVLGEDGCRPLHDSRARRLASGRVLASAAGPAGTRFFAGGRSPTTRRCLAITSSSRCSRR